MTITAVGGAWSDIGAYVTGFSTVTLTAYAANRSVLETVSTPAGSNIGTPNEWLEVSAANIAYVTFFCNTPAIPAFAIDDLHFNIEPLPPNVTVVSSLNPATSGQPVTFTATVSPATSSQPTPTGTVTFMDGSTDLGSGQLNASGVATFTTSTLAVGTHSIKAVYGGDSNFGSKTSSPVTQTVNPISTATGTLSLTDLKWNVGADGTAANAGDRGLDFTYQVTGTLPPVAGPITIGFYWANGTTLSNIISQAEPKPVAIDLSPGIHTGNDPARWGLPPSGATYVMAVIDSGDELPQSNKSLISQTQPLPKSINDIFNTPIDVKIVEAPDTGNKKGKITASFYPGGGSISVSEAEVYLGIDHFNWIQYYTVPSRWKSYIFVGLQYTGDDLTREVVLTKRGFRYENPGGKIDWKTTITAFRASKPLIDPIVQPSASSGPHGYTEGDVIGANRRVVMSTIGSDMYKYFYDENDSFADLGPEMYSSMLAFDDRPYVPAVFKPYHKREEQSFHTMLVPKQA